MSTRISKVTIHFDSSWDKAAKAGMRRGLTQMTLDIHRQAVINSPKLTRALANSGRVEKTGDFSYEVIFGGGRVPYARYREYVNHAHPWTTHYLGRAGDKAKSHAAQYFQNLV